MPSWNIQRIFWVVSVQSLPCWIVPDQRWSKFMLGMWNWSSGCSIGPGSMLCVRIWYLLRSHKWHCLLSLQSRHISGGQRHVILLDLSGWHVLYRGRSELVHHLCAGYVQLADSCRVVHAVCCRHVHYVEQQSVVVRVMFVVSDWQIRCVSWIDHLFGLSGRNVSGESGCHQLHSLPC
jgi:hypothetical protein